MVKRFLAGYHAGFNQMGIWLSVPGYDVSGTGTAANFLLRPDLKNTQIVLSGTIVVPPTQTITVALPANLNKRPYIMVKGNINGNTEYPSSLSAAVPGSSGNELYFNILIYTDQFQFYNFADFATVYGFFMVFSRSIGV